MTLVYPYALLLLLPALGLAAWLMLWRGQAALRLPGHWHRTIEGALQPFMARQVVSQNRLPLLMWIALWTLLVLALARPILDHGAPASYGNLAGRVIALDLGAGADIDHQRSVAYRILDAAPTVPTALVVGTGEAFGIVPFTTDRGHLDRYLHVVDPALMPIGGRAPGISIVHAESMLQRADLVVGQMVLLSGGQVPRAEPARAVGWLRALVVNNDRHAEWSDYADRLDARLTDDARLQVIIDDLDRAVADAVRDRQEASEFGLAAWLVAFAGLLWLLFFRRMRGA